MPLEAPYVAAATAVEQFAEEETLDGRVLDYTGAWLFRCLLFALLFGCLLGCLLFTWLLVVWLARICSPESEIMVPN